MAKRDKDKKRARPVILQTRMSEDEAALVREKARKFAVSVSAVLRYGALELPPLPASRTPTIDREIAARLLAELGQCTTAFRQATEAGNAQVHAALIEAVHRDLSDMRVALFEALGRQP